MARLTRLIRTALWLLLAAAAAFALYAWAKANPQDLPWTPLDLGEPVGAFTGRKLTGLTQHPEECRALLDRAGIRYVALAPVDGVECGYDDAVRFDPGGVRNIRYSPEGLGASCPVAAALAVWEWNSVQPAAQKRFGARVTRIEHFGSFSCRRMYGRNEGAWSEHATADAVDIAGFVLSDGTRISVVGDWDGEGAKAEFLRDVRNGACKLFATVLSPEYNAAHRDHFHFDQAERGEMGWRACR